MRVFCLYYQNQIHRKINFKNDNAFVSDFNALYKFFIF